MVVDREDVLKEHQKTAFGSSGNAVKVAYRPLEGYPCAFLSFFDAEKLKRVLNSRGISAGLRAQFLSISVVYASSQPFQTLLVVLEAVVITRVVKSSLAAEGNALSSAAYGSKT